MYLLALSDIISFSPFYYTTSLATVIDKRSFFGRYQFNPHLSRDETVTNILVKALTVFPAPDFSLCLSLLPPSTLLLAPSKLPGPGSNAPSSEVAEAVQKLSTLNTLLASADYSSFWSTLDSDDLYADLVADVSGFEELMRVRIAINVSQAVREIQKPVLEDWLNLKGKEFERFVGEICGWAVDGETIKVPLNKENEAKGTVVRENVKFDRMYCAATVVRARANTSAEFSRLVRRAYEQPA